MYKNRTNYDTFARIMVIINESYLYYYIYHIKCVFLGLKIISVFLLYIYVLLFSKHFLLFIISTALQKKLIAKEIKEKNTFMKLNFTCNGNGQKLLCTIALYPVYFVCCRRKQAEKNCKGSLWL